MYECTRESGVTHTAQSLHAHYLSKQKKQKHLNYKPWHERRLGKERRNNDICNNANPPTIFNKTQYLFETKKRECDTLYTHTKRNYTTLRERERGRWCKRRVDCLSLALTIAITKMSRRIVEENTHTDSQQQLIISKMFTRERKIYKCRKMIISTRYNKCYLL